MGVILAGLSALLYGGADFAGGFASRRASAMSVVAVSQIFGIAAALIAAPIIGAGAVTFSDLMWGAAAGVGGAVGLIALYRGIADAIVAIVSPTAALLGAVIPLIFGLAIGERPHLLSWIGIALCLPAVLLFSLGGKTSGDLPHVARSLLFGAGAGIGFGLFFIAISRPSSEAGLWPLVAARFFSVVLVVIAATASGRRPFAVTGSLGIVAMAGVFDMSANVAFVLSTRFSLLAVATVVASLYPGPTVLLGRIVFHQRVGALKLAGFACAVGGVALIGLGSL